MDDRTGGAGLARDDPVVHGPHGVGVEADGAVARLLGRLHAFGTRPLEEDNTFGLKVDRPTRTWGSHSLLFCFYDLEPNEALLVETGTPDARYWSFQLYGLQYFRPSDIGRPTSLNHRQIAKVDDRVHVVVAHRDPGVPNWLDTTGRRARAAQLPAFLGSAAAQPTAPASCLSWTSATSCRRTRRPSARPSLRPDPLAAMAPGLALPDLSIRCRVVDGPLPTAVVCACRGAPR